MFGDEFLDCGLIKQRGLCPLPRSHHRYTSTLDSTEHALDQPFNRPFQQGLDGVGFGSMSGYIGCSLALRDIEPSKVSAPLSASLSNQFITVFTTRRPLVSEFAISQ